MMLLEWPIGSATVRLGISADEPVRVIGVDPPDDDWGADRPVATPLVELGLDAGGHTGTSPNGQHRLYSASVRLRYVTRQETVEPTGRVLRIVQRDPVTAVEVTSRLERRDGATAVRAETLVENRGTVPVMLRYVSSLNLAGFTGEPVAADPERLVLSWARNGWATEFRWQHHSLEQAGIVDPSPPGGARHDSSRAHLGVASFGSWSTGNFLAVGAVTDQRTGRCWTWQIEHNGAWQWQAFDINSSLALTLSGPTSAEHSWSLRLGPGERFCSVPATLAVSPGGLEGALAEMTRHRRLTRRPNRDNRECPVIFNDYMNCLMGDPTTEKLRPLVRAAAEAGCEYFVIDCGWYSDDPGWWDTVGDWEPAATRFPRGLGEVTDAIKAAGMTPGLWLEPEVAGVRSAVTARFPADAYFCRDGRPIIENGRYQLDFTHPEVTRHLNATIDRLIGHFGIGYLKLDYNINIGHGTDTRGRTPGAGLLDHNRAYSRWLDALFARHPGLVVENCSSGGMRADYAQLSRLSVQSTSDQVDPVLYAAIAASAASAVTPEQAAVWAYPQPDWSGDLNDLTLVNALLGRVHLSGRVDQLGPAALRRVAEAVGVYKRIRRRIPHATATWPLGLPRWYDEWIAAGLADTEGMLLQLWRRGGKAQLDIPIRALTGRAAAVAVLFPGGSPARAGWDPRRGVLSTHLPGAPSACLLEIRPELP
jgi:alpha-galactosidase